jgi:hypothetical protein
MGGPYLQNRSQGKHCKGILVDWLIDPGTMMKMFERNGSKLLDVE